MNIEPASEMAQRAAFLAALEQGLSISGAAAAAGVDRLQCYRWRSDSAEFAFAWDQAVQAGVDMLEDVMLRRAVHGVEKPVFYRGQQVGVVMVCSDRLLVLLQQQRRRPATREVQVGEAARHQRTPSPIMSAPEPAATTPASDAIAPAAAAAASATHTPVPPAAAEAACTPATPAMVLAAPRPAADPPPGRLARTELSNTLDAVLSAAPPRRMPRCVLEHRPPAAPPGMEALQLLSDAELAKRLRELSAEARSPRQELRSAA